MTLLDSRPEASVGAAAAGDVDLPVAGAAVEQALVPQTGAETLVRALVLVLVAAIAMTVVWKAFDQILAPSIFRARQQHLAADYTKQRPGLEHGQAAGVLQIPGIGANLMLVEGSDPNALRGAPGHRPGTPTPGAKGNSVIEGHRTRWGGPFADLPKLVERTRIVAMDRSGIPVEYRVTVVKVVKRDALARYLAPSRDHRITLVTHAGGSFSDDMFVVQAVAGTPSNKAATGGAKAPSTDLPTGSLLPAVVALVLSLGAALAAFVRLRRDHGRWAIGMVVVPLLAGAALALLLAVDGTVSSLL